MKEISKKTEKQTENSCSKHGTKLLFFCETCEKSICRDCTVLDHNISAGHVVIDVAEAEDSHRQALLKQMDEQRSLLTQIQGNVESLELELALLTGAKETTKEELIQFIQLAHKKLDDRQDELIESNEEQFKEKRNILLAKEIPLIEAIDTLNNNINQAENLVKNGTLDEVKAINETLTSSTKDIQSNFVELDLGKNHISFDSSIGREAFERCLCGLGEITVKDVLPAKCEFEHIETMAGQKTEMQVRLFSYQGESITCTTNHFAVEISDPDGTNITNVLTTTEHGYSVTFTPQMSGPHKVSGMFLGHHLCHEQSQILVSSNNPVLKFGTYGNGDGTFDGPCGIAIASDSCLYVSDYYNGLIQKFTAEGEFLSQFSVAAHKEDSSTLDIEFDANRGLLLCMEISNKDKLFSRGKNILAFNMEGELQHTYTPNYIRNARCIAVNSQSEFLITDIDNKCLSKIDRDGNFLCKIGNFKKPGFIAIADDDIIIVPDRGDDCVYIFNPDGSVRHKFGISGAGKGQLKGPRGVATDGEYILVCEEGNKRIQIFNHDLSLVSVIESIEDPIAEPYGMAVTNDGHVYVADAGQNCIKKYRYRHD